MAHPHNRLNLLGVRWKQNREGHDAKIGQSVAFVGVKFFGRRNQAMCSDDGAEFLKNAGVHGRLSGIEKLSPAAGVPQSSLPHQCTNVKPCGMNCGKTYA